MARRMSWQADRARRRVARLLTLAIDEQLPLSDARVKMRQRGEPVSIASAKRFAPGAIEKDVFGRWRARRDVYDRLPRRLRIISVEEGVVIRDVRGRHAASIVARHAIAVKKYLGGEADERVLEPFIGKRAAGLTLETDTGALLVIGRSGDLAFLELYEEE